MSHNHKVNFNARSAGVLMPVFSLPSRYGIGCFGEFAYKFVDFLATAKQKFWQILPLNPTDSHNSPYASPASFAGNPLFIDLELLVQDNLLDKNDLPAPVVYNKNIDYAAIKKINLPLLKKAFNNFLKIAAPSDYVDFLERNSSWIYAYARHSSTGKSAAVDYFLFEQYIFYNQWFKLKAFANSKGVYIIGDIPLYVEGNSVDALSCPELFLLGENGKPNMVAGCPPDDFSKDGQKWGNPLYNWQAHKDSGYKWWIERVAHSLHICDAVRLDHFRGLESFYAIPINGTALEGMWKTGGGEHFINTINAWFNGPSLIAEDLGHITDGVRRLLEISRYPTMRVLNFAFNESNGKSEHIVHNFARHTVAYTQTHDTDTIVGLYNSANNSIKKDIKDYFRVASAANLGFSAACTLLQSTANTAIVPLSDYLNMGAFARINTPGTTGNHNWSFNFDKSALTQKLAKSIAKQVVLTNRC